MRRKAITWKESRNVVVIKACAIISGKTNCGRSRRSESFGTEGREVRVEKRT